MSIVQRVNQVMEEAVASEKIVGAVVMVFKHGQPLLRRAIGYADREARTKVQLDTIFRFASVTKPFVAATALSQIDKGLLGLDDLVVDHLPWFQPKTPSGELARITVRHLLTHTSGMTYDAALQRLPRDQAINLGLINTDLSLEENFSRYNAVPLAFAPGERWAYSVAIDVLGAVVAKVHGASTTPEQQDPGAVPASPSAPSESNSLKRHFESIEGRNTLEAAVIEHVCEPLRMKDARFHVTDMSRLAVPYGDGEQRAERMEDLWQAKALWGEGPIFSPSRIFNPRAFQSGGGGMVGTALDVVTLLETIRTGGGSIMSPDLAQGALTNQIGDVPMLPGKRFSFIGAVITSSSAAETALPPGAVQWGGVYGNTWFIVPEAGLTVVSMSNTALEGCDGAYVERLRAAVCQEG